METQGDIDSASIWFHGASVGDLKSLQPIVNGINLPRFARSTVTYWTREAALIAPTLFEESVVRRAPTPFQLSTKRFLQRHHVKCCVMEYLELFPGWVKAARSQSIPMGVINGRVTSRSLRIRSLLRSSAASLEFFWAQTERDAENAARLGVPDRAIEVLGSTKHSRLLYGTPPPVTRLRQEVGRFGVVVGSVHPDEEQQVVEACMSYGERALIVPRYLSQAERLHRYLCRSGVEVAYRTDEQCSKTRVVILNTIGELHAAYGLAPISIVGGTFGRRGGQNLLEPITMGKPVVYGPRHHRVEEEVIALKDAGGIGVATIKDAFDLAESQHHPTVDLAAIRRHFPQCIEETLRRLRETLSA